MHIACKPLASLLNFESYSCVYPFLLRSCYHCADLLVPIFHFESTFDGAKYISPQTYNLFSYRLQIVSFFYSWTVYIEMTSLTKKKKTGSRLQKVDLAETNPFYQMPTRHLMCAIRLLFFAGFPRTLVINFGNLTGSTNKPCNV